MNFNVIEFHPFSNQFNNLTTPHEIIERIQTCFTQNDDNIFRGEPVLNYSTSEKDTDEKDDLHVAGNDDTTALREYMARDIITFKKKKMTILSLKI